MDIDKVNIDGPIVSKAKAVSRVVDRGRVVLYPFFQMKTLPAVQCVCSMVELWSFPAQMFAVRLGQEFPD